MPETMPGGPGPDDGGRRLQNAADRATERLLAGCGLSPELRPDRPGAADRPASHVGGGVARRQSRTAEDLYQRLWEGWSRHSRAYSAETTTRQCLAGTVGFAADLVAGRLRCAGYTEEHLADLRIAGIHLAESLFEDLPQPDERLKVLLTALLGELDEIVRREAGP